jgi:uncharacterized repeat protein (TIGR01451 family)
LERRDDARRKPDAHQDQSRRRRHLQILDPCREMKIGLPLGVSLSICFPFAILLHQFVANEKERKEAGTVFHGSSAVPVFSWKLSLNGFMHNETFSAARPTGFSWVVKHFGMLVSSFALLAANAALAQPNFTVGTNLVDISRIKGNETDPSIAFNPLGPSNMVVAAATDGTVPGLFLAFTTNQGVSWKTNVIATNNDAQGLIPAYGEPSVAWDSYGNLFLAYLPDTFEGVAVAVSTNGGQTFASVTNLAALDATDQPRITAPIAGAAAGSVWIVYKDYTTANTPLQVQGALSTGLGSNGIFDVVEMVPGSGAGGFADIAVGPMGQVVVAFQDNLQGLPNPAAYPTANLWVSIETNAISSGSESENGFSQAQIVAADAIGGVTYISAAPSGIGVNAAPGLSWNYDTYETNYDNVYLIYTAVGPNGNAVISFISSDGSATNWSGETYVDDDATNGFNDHFLPRVAVDPASGIIGCSWYDCRNDQGSSSQPIINEFVDNFLLTGYMVTNVYFTNAYPFISETWIDETGQGTNITIMISADDVNGTMMKKDKSDNVYIYGPTGTNFIMYLAGTNTNVTASVTVILSSIFPMAYTSGTGGNQEAIMYTTLSFDGGMSFLANRQLMPADETIEAPAVGIASDVAGSDSLTGWGHYTALAAYGGNFFPVWADNSDVTTNNPDGANNNFDLYMLNSTGSISVPTADLSIWVTNAPNPVISEGVLVYSLVVSNNGPEKAGPVTVTNILSPYVTLEAVIPALGGAFFVNDTTNGQEEVVLTLPLLAAHASLTNTVRVTATTSSVDTNIATVYSSLIDLFPANNSNQLVLVIDGQDLAMGMTASETNVLIGDTVVSSITVTNLGPATNGPVFITNQFSPNWTNVTVQAQGTNLVTYTPSGPLVIANLGHLPVGQPVTATFTAVALSIGTAAWESATVASQDVDTNPVNNSAFITYFVNGEDLAIGMTSSSATVDLGQTITYAINVTNFGLSYSGLVTVSNIFSPNLEPWSATQSQGTNTIENNQVVFNLGVLGVGQIASMTVSALALSGPPSATNVASVSSTDFNTNLDNIAATNLATIYGEDLAISLSAFPTGLQVGQTVTYTEQVTNLGPSTNGVVLVTNTLSANLSSITVLQPATNYSISQNVVVFDLGTLYAGQIVPITLTAIPTSTGIGLNTATVGSQDFDTNLANNTSQAAVTITPALPMISNLVVTPLASSAFVAWDTGAAATAQVLYGATSTYGSFSAVTATAATHHAVLLTGLTGGTNYAFEVLSWVGSKLYTTNGSFTLTNTLILNTQDAIYTGLWTKGTVATGIYGAYYQFATTTLFDPTAWALYDPYIPAAGLYDVYIWYPQNATFTTNAQVYVHGGTNDLILSVNETAHGGAWQPLATNMYFASGTNGNVILYNDTGDTNKYLVANAMMWVYDAAQDYPTNGAVPAWWANFYFGANANGYVNGAADADGDGYSNYAEYVFGTDPTNAASFLSFTVSPVSSNVLSVTFSPWQGGRTYQLQAAFNLTDPVWTTLTNGYTLDTNGSGVFTVTQTNSAGSFYRLSAQVTH